MPTRLASFHFSPPCTCLTSWFCSVKTPREVGALSHPHGMPSVSLALSDRCLLSFNTYILHLKKNKYMVSCTRRWQVFRGTKSKIRRIATIGMRFQIQDKINNLAKVHLMKATDPEKVRCEETWGKLIQAKNIQYKDTHSPCLTCTRKGKDKYN